MKFEVFIIIKKNKEKKHKLKTCFRLVIGGGSDEFVYLNCCYLLLLQFVFDVGTVK